MAAVQQPSRQDVDILEAVHDVVAKYPPLTADRHHLRVSVQSGVVVLEGHVKTPITRLYVVERVAALAGVRGLSADGLFDDETIRLEVGQRLPEGVLANPAYGVVVLSGKVPEGMTDIDVAQLAGAVPGVTKVVTHFV
ncbi:MAG: BON domain-containing protein [Anaerolineae bacterium]